MSFYVLHFRPPVIEVRTEYVDREPVIVEKIIEKPVDRIVEKIINQEIFVDRPVDRIVEVEKKVEVPVYIDRPVEKLIDRIVEVEKRIEVPVDRIIEKIIEKPATQLMCPIAEPIACTSIDIKPKTKTITKTIIKWRRAKEKICDKSDWISPGSFR